MDPGPRRSGRSLKATVPGASYAAHIAKIAQKAELKKTKKGSKMNNGTPTTAKVRGPKGANAYFKKVLKPRLLLPQEPRLHVWNGWVPRSDTALSVPTALAPQPVATWAPRPVATWAPRIRALPAPTTARRSRAPRMNSITRHITRGRDMRRKRQNMQRRGTNTTLSRVPPPEENINSMFRGLTLR